MMFRKPLCWFLGALLIGIVVSLIGVWAIQPFQNSLGLKFVPAGTDGVLFCIWDVRVKDYTAFVRESGHPWEKTDIQFFQYLPHHFAQSENDPAVNVSWEDAKAFCVWLTVKERASGYLKSNQVYRLPTDAEWSRAVGLDEPTSGSPADKNGKIKDFYPWGSAYPPPGNVGDYDYLCDTPAGPASTHILHNTATTPVGSFNANPYGLYDMGGNVWQWCEDKYQPDNDDRVMRGASWRDSFADETDTVLPFKPGDTIIHMSRSAPPAPDLFASRRDHLDPTQHKDNVGFRIVLAVSP